MAENTMIGGVVAAIQLLTRNLDQAPTSELESPHGHA